MFTAALFTIGKIWKQPMSPLIDGQKYVAIYIYMQRNITKP